MIKRRGRMRREGPASPLSAGARAPSFALADTPHSRVALDDFRGRAVVLVFYVADWHPVATDQLAVYQELQPHLERLGAAVVGISVDATWSHDAFARAHGIRLPLLSDDAPPGAVARSYGVYVPETGRSRRALFVVDEKGTVRWSDIYPDVLNPGADGVLSALEALAAEGRLPSLPSPSTTLNGHLDRCPCGCGLSIVQVGNQHANKPDA